MKRLLMPVDHSPDPRYAWPEAMEVLEGLGDETSEMTLLHVGKKMKCIMRRGRDGAGS